MTIAFGTSGASGAGTTSLSIPYPASIAADDLLVLFIANKYPTNGPSTPSGWIAPSGNQYSGGAGAAGVDSGAAYITVYVRVADGTETGNLSVTLTSSNTAIGKMLRYTKAAGTVWSYACAGGSDDTDGTDWSVTAGSDPGVIDNDMVVVGNAIHGNIMTMTTQVLTQTGCTFGATSERQDSGTNNGDDVSLNCTDHKCTAGTSSAVPSYTATVSVSNASGATLFLRLREIPLISLETVSSTSSIPVQTFKSIITTSHISSDNQLFTLALSNVITPNAIPSNSVAYNLSLQNIVALEHIISTNTLFDANLQLSIALGFIAEDNQLFNATYNLTSALGTISSDNQTFSLTLQSTIVLEYIDSISALYDADFFASSGGLDIFLSHIPNANNVYTPEFGYSLAFGHIPTETNVYDLQFQHTIVLPFITSNNLFYAPVFTPHIPQPFTGFIQIIYQVAAIPEINKDDAIIYLHSYQNSVILMDGN